MDPFAYEIEHEDVHGRTWTTRHRNVTLDRTPSTLQAYLDAGSPALPNPGITSKPKQTRRRRRKNGSHK